MRRIAFVAAALALFAPAGAPARHAWEPEYGESAAHPRPGRYFVGLYLGFPHPATFVVTKITCDAKLGGSLQPVEPGGPIAHVGGRRLRPILKRYYTKPDASGRRYLARITCGWRIPRTAARKLLSTWPPPAALGCPDGCFAWGLSLEYGTDPSDPRPCCFRSWTDATWRVRRH